VLVVDWVGVEVVEEVVPTTSMGAPIPWAYKV
jgi:hypothetical protein